MPSPPSLFDAALESRGLGPTELRELRHFGVRFGLAAPPGGPRPRDGAELAERWERFLATDLPALEGAGLIAFALLGAPPEALPLRGLEVALHRLAPLFGRRRAVAVGPVSLGAGDPEAEHALRRQLELAREVNRPLVARLAPGQPPRAALTRLLDVLEEGGAEPARVLIEGAGRTSFRALRERGYHVALRPLSHRLTAAAAADLVSRHGSEGVLLASGAGSGHADLLAVPKVTAALEERGVPLPVIRRVAFQNAVTFFNLDVSAYER